MMFLVIIVLFFHKKLLDKVSLCTPAVPFFLLCGACVHGVLLIGR